MLEINWEAFNSDPVRFRTWATRFGGYCLPDGWGQQRDWLPPDGLAPASETNGPPDSLLLYTYPGCDPTPTTYFMDLPGGPECLDGLLAACRTEYEYIADGCIALSLLGSLLVRTAMIFAEQEGMATEVLEALRHGLESF